MWNKKLGFPWSSATQLLSPEQPLLPVFNVFFHTLSCIFNVPPPQIITCTHPCLFHLTHGILEIIQYHYTQRCFILLNGWILVHYTGPLLMNLLVSTVTSAAWTSFKCEGLSRIILRSLSNIYRCLFLLILFILLCLKVICFFFCELFVSSVYFSVQLLVCYWFWKNSLYRKEISFCDTYCKYLPVFL